MASRYGNEEYERYGEGRRPGRSREQFGRDRENRDFSSTGGFDRSDENYFGSSRQSYGGGYTGEMDTEQSSWRSGRGYGSYDEPGRRYSGRRSDFDRDYTSERDRRFTGGGYSGRSGYSGGNYGRGSYGSDFPESERGYMTGRSSQEDRGWLDRASDTVSSWLGDEEAERRLRNEERRGEFRGRGPRNYTRSDERIREDINDRLTDADYLDASEIDVQVNNGEVILTGTVDSRWAKRHAEDIAEDVSSVKNVENRIRVNQTTYGLESSSFTGTTGSTSSTGSTETTGKPKGRSATG